MGEVVGDNVVPALAGDDVVGFLVGTPVIGALVGLLVVDALIGLPVLLLDLVLLALDPPDRTRSLYKWRYVSWVVSTLGTVGL